MVQIGYERHTLALVMTLSPDLLCYNLTHYLGNWWPEAATATWRHRESAHSTTWTNRRLGEPDRPPSFTEPDWRVARRRW